MNGLACATTTYQVAVTTTTTAECKSTKTQPYLRIAYVSVHNEFHVGSSCALVFAPDRDVAAITAALEHDALVITSRAEFAAAVTMHRPVVAYVAVELLPQVEEHRGKVAIVGVVDGALDDVLRTINEFPWLPHVVATALLKQPFAAAHLALLHDRIGLGPEHQVLGDHAIGRVALLAHSARREARFERLREFFAEQKISKRTITTLNDVAEELVSNALYDAPIEAGYFKAPVMRSTDVELPPEHACEISYGVERGEAFVRIRDPFGSLTRERIMGVLNRCNATDVPLDESRGGAGLGLWRVFSSVSMIAITVIPGRLTDVVVWADAKRSRSHQLLAVHLFFPDDHLLDGIQSRFAADHDYDLMDDSFTAVI